MTTFNQIRQIRQIIQKWARYRPIWETARNMGQTWDRWPNIGKCGSPSPAWARYGKPSRYGPNMGGVAEHAKTEPDMGPNYAHILPFLDHDGRRWEESAKIHKHGKPSPISADVGNKAQTSSDVGNEAKHGQTWGTGPDMGTYGKQPPASARGERRNRHGAFRMTGIDTRGKANT